MEALHCGLLVLVCCCCCRHPLAGVQPNEARPCRHSLHALSMWGLLWLSLCTKMFCRTVGVCPIAANHSRVHVCVRLAQRSKAASITSTAAAAAAAVELLYHSAIISFLLHLVHELCLNVAHRCDEFASAVIAV